jgi:hypothetical protein
VVGGAGSWRDLVRTREPRGAIPGNWQQRADAPAARPYLGMTAAERRTPRRCVPTWGGLGSIGGWTMGRGGVTLRGGLS